MSKKKSKFEWRSKFIDLLIVIIGISIAFKVNTWSESNKSELEGQYYLERFYDENKSNKEGLTLAIEFSINNKIDVDTLKQILIHKKYNDSRIINLSASMMGMADFVPTTITMENILASGDFELIKDIEIREKLISTYNSFETSLKLEKILNDYLNDYLTPFFFDNVRFSDFSSINLNYLKDPKFENIVFGYEILLSQEIRGYQNTLDKIKELNNILEKVN